MLETNLPITEQWPLWKKILFRFFFIYLLLLIAPWTAIGAIPGLDHITQYYSDFIDWAVQSTNARYFHIAKVLVPPAGSGDTSWGWAEQWLYSIVATVGCIIWSIADRKRPNYNILNYWNCLFVRYSLSAICFTYGVSKILILQMPAPSLSRLATPLGYYTPMRFFWLLMGYSQPYEFFSGLMELIAGILLLYKRTATLGTLLAFAIFVNVAMLNLSYDICVKIFSIQLVVYCLVLMANERKRLINFLVLNRMAKPASMYEYPYQGKRMRITRIVIKLFFLIFIVGSSLLFQWNRYKTAHAVTNIAPLKMGMYEVTSFVVNKDTIPPLLTDTLRWQDLILEGRNSGSINTLDSAFRREYGRAYFIYKVDSAKHLLSFKRNRSDSLPFITFQYQLPDDNILVLFGKRNNDSLFVSLKRSSKRYPLPDNQFHWLQETPP